MKVLALVITTAAALAFAYGVAAWFDNRRDPFADLFLILIAAPAMPPLVLGVFLVRGHRWALHGLRVAIVLVLAGGAWLTWGLGVGVFSYPPFAVPFVGACLLWLALSFALDRRGPERRSAGPNA